jgi:hypothetical protein
MWVLPAAYSIIQQAPEGFRVLSLTCGLLLGCCCHSRKSKFQSFDRKIGANPAQILWANVLGGDSCGNYKPDRGSRGLKSPLVELQAAVATVATAGNQPTCSPKSASKLPFQPSQPITIVTKGYLTQVYYLEWAQTVLYSLC